MQSLALGIEHMDVKNLESCVGDAQFTFERDQIARLQISGNFLRQPICRRPGIFLEFVEQFAASFEDGIERDTAAYRDDDRHSVAY